MRYIKDLKKFSGCPTDLPFAGLPVLVCGDRYQFSPVKETPIHNMKGFFSVELWGSFEIAELNEVMRQQEDYEFILLLNKIRVGTVDDEAEKLLKSRLVAEDDLLYLKHAAHMFAENCSVVDYNELI